MKSDDQNNLAVRVISEKIAQLEPDIASQVSEARQSLAEMVRLLEEQRTLQGAIESLQGTRQEPDIDERWAMRSRDPLFRAQRALREIDMIERDRDPERRRPVAPSDLTVRGRPGGQSGEERAEKLDIVAFAQEFATSNGNLARLPDLAALIVKRDPSRYRNVATAQASLYYHLGKSELFEKVRAGTFRLIDPAGAATERNGEER